VRVPSLALLLLRVTPVRLGRAPRRGAPVAATVAAAASASAEVERECGPRRRRVLRVLLRLRVHALVCGLCGGGGLARRPLHGADLGLRLDLAPD
jgi:hypothetical protein